MGQYFPYFQKEPYRMYYVINTKRPLSATEGDILSMLQEIQHKSRLGVTHLINNTNLSYETKTCDIIEGHILISRISQSVEIPIACIAGVSELLEQLPGNMECSLFPISIFMKPPWR